MLNQKINCSASDENIGKNGCRRFFAQQFKRSCLPDGSNVGTVALSSIGDWRMPSDACASIWLNDIEELQKK